MTTPINLLNDSQNRTREICEIEKKLEKQLQEETIRLLAMGYTEKQLDNLDAALEYICFPIVEMYFNNPELLHEEEIDLNNT